MSNNDIKAETCSYVKLFENTLSIWLLHKMFLIAKAFLLMEQKYAYCCDIISEVLREPLCFQNFSPS